LSEPFRSLPRYAVPSQAASMNLPQPMIRLCLAENTTRRETPGGRIVRRNAFIRTIRQTPSPNAPNEIFPAGKPVSTGVAMISDLQC
jgi:hypothetical protein